MGGSVGGTSDVVEFGGSVSGDETASGVNGEFALLSGEGCVSPAGDAGFDGPRRWKRKCDSIFCVLKDLSRATLLVRCGAGYR
ncbi:hypothetical protein NLG97_g4277 [Lecanicillium saksenae]|uniref:Uncharacterized protein n=1 Tax=Lecanicillium saksenae TaxID=468837 RepID=A0ACC1QXG3_9HYPO|nr:hypothetical protein NLG97_g4277 [Lecanicillium saksenae]